MITKNIRFVVAIAFCLLITPNESLADTVRFDIRGTADVEHSQFGLLPSQIFMIEFSIDSSQTDILPDDLQRGAFEDGVARLSIPSIGINREVSTNVTGLVLVDTGIERVRLIDPTSLFDTTGFGLQWDQSLGIDNPNTLTALNASNPPIDFAYGNLAWEFGGPISVSFSNFSNVVVQSDLAVIPEGPGVGVLTAMGLFLTTSRRKTAAKRIRKREE